jgi:hypothetical protein
VCADSIGPLAATTRSGVSVPPVAKRDRLAVLAAGTTTCTCAACAEYPAWALGLASVATRATSPAVVSSSGTMPGVITHEAPTAAAADAAAAAALVVLATFFGVAGPWGLAPRLYACATPSKYMPTEPMRRCTSSGLSV